MEEMQISNIGISLFEEQIVRTFFISDNFSLLKRLSKQNQVYIFTNQNIGKFLTTKFFELNIQNVQVLIIHNYRENFTLKLLYSFFRWSDPSTGTLRNLFRERNSRRMNLFGFWFRLIFYRLMSHFKILKIFCRKLLVLSFSTRNFESQMSIHIPKLRVFFSTALTNTESDLPLSIYFSKKGAQVVSTLRSWDNLVTKGTLKFQPDVFISHSKYMTDLALNIHAINPVSIIEGTTPSYQVKFLPRPKKLSNRKRKISYGCIGPILNPDEIHFIEWLGQISTKIDVEITVVQHPKFLHDLRNIETGNLVFMKFDYLSSSLTDYYMHLSKQDLIIASGTSFALDTLFVNTPFIALCFEIIGQDYWLSHLRSYDLVPHSRFLFDNLDIKKVYDKENLIEILERPNATKLPNSKLSNLQEITGDTSIEFNDLIVSILT